MRIPFPEKRKRGDWTRLATGAPRPHHLTFTELATKETRRTAVAGFDTVMYPSDCDRLSVVVRKARFPTEPLADHRYDLFVYVNGRPVAESPGGPIAPYQRGLASMLLRFPTAPIPWRIGLYSVYGGRWSGFRVWVQY